MSAMTTESPKVSISPELCKSLINTQALSFVQYLIKKSYKDFFPDNVPEVNTMVDQAFQLLTNSQRQPGLESLIEAVRQIHRTIFIQDPDHWFYKIHKNYKAHIRPKEDFKKISAFIDGRSILDIGAGAGYFASELKHHGYDVTAMDVLDYRSGSARDIKFIRMNTATELSVDGQFDTAFLKTVLHHIRYDDIPILLANIRKSAKRLIIEEDVFGLTNRDTSSVIYLQHDLDFFCTLSQSDQRDVLILMDFFGNIIVYSIDEMALPFQFKTLREWEELLPELGWNVTKKIIVGFDTTRIHRPCQAWLICD
jgi:2-polyprenyl-3-methyl-5-hydroxy-6-metoxy-1,4-benzoquinol methylase